MLHTNQKGSFMSKEQTPKSECSISGCKNKPTILVEIMSSIGQEILPLCAIHHELLEDEQIDHREES